MIGLTSEITGEVSYHKPLASIFGKPNSKPPARIERWMLHQQPYKPSVVCRSGADNPADYMSQHPNKLARQTSWKEKVAEEYVNYAAITAVPKALTVTEVKQATAKDWTLRVAVQSPSHRSVPQASDILHWWLCFQILWESKGGIHCQCWRKPRASRSQNCSARTTPATCSRSCLWGTSDDCKDKIPHATDNVVPWNRHEG